MIQAGGRKQRDETIERGGVGLGDHRLPCAAQLFGNPLVREGLADRSAEWGTARGRGS